MKNTLFEQIKTKILKKVNKHNFNFSKEELFILSKDEETFIYVIDKIIDHEKALETTNAANLILNREIYSDNPIIEQIINKHEKTLEEILVHLFKNPYSLSFSSILEFYENPEYNFTEEQIKEVKETYKSFMMDPNFSFNTFNWDAYECDSVSSFINEYVIPYKRVDILDNFYSHNGILTFSNELIDSLENKYINDTQNLDLIGAIILFLNGNEKVFDIIISKIKTSNDFTIKNSMHIWYAIITKLDFIKRDTLYKVAFEKGVVDFITMPESGYLAFLKDNNLLEKFNSIYKSNNTSDSLYLNLTLGKNDKVLKEEDIIWFLENGYFNFVLSFDKNELVHKYLCDYVKNNQEKFKNYFIPSKLYRIIKDDLELLDILVKAKCGKRKSRFDFEGLYQIFYNGENIVEAFILLADYKRESELFFKNLLDYMQGKYTSKEVNFNILELKKLITSNVIFADEFIDKFINEIITKKDLLRIYVSLDDYYIEKILEQVLHNESFSFFYNHETYLILRDYLSKKYKVTKENLDMIESAFGPKIIKYIDNESIQDILKLPKVMLIKVIDLFPNLDYTKTDAETLYDTLKQYEYTKVNSTDVSLFTMFKDALQNKETKKITYLINLLVEKLDSNFKKRFPKYKDTSFEIYLNYLCSNFLITNNGEWLTQIRNIINDYLVFSREEYRKTYDFYRECNIKEEIPVDGNEKAICFGILGVTRYNPNTYIIKYINSELNKLGYNVDVIELLKFYVHGESVIIDKTIIENLKECIKPLIGIIKSINMFDKKQYIDYAVKNDKSIVKIKHVIEQNNDIFSILSNLNVSALRKNILNNDEIYKSLLQVMKKYKLHKIPLSFQELLSSENINMEGTLYNLGDFISHYYVSYMEEKNKLIGLGQDKEVNIPLIKILQDANVFSVASNIYSMVLTKKDASLIKSNSGVNAAIHKTKGNERLNEAINYTLMCFERDKVCVPTFNEVIDLGSKKIRVIVGNFTNPCNITHGERTDACMRIGGHAHSLFDFALRNPHGFHIRFEDAETHEYISRVTGFRNGNTVFLNELRYSLVPKFSNQDVFIACKKISDMMVEESRKTKYRIDNVLLTPTYVVEYHDVIPMRERNLNRGIGRFYYDFTDKAVIVSTTSKTKDTIMPINFDNSREVYYLPARDVVREVRDALEFTTTLNRINSIKKLKKGIDLKEIEQIYIEDFVYGIVNNDFYVYINTKGEIIEDIIETDKRAFDELEEARKKVIKEAKKLGIDITCVKRLA